MKTTVVVMGVTGTVGSEVARRAALAGLRVRAASRTPQRSSGASGYEPVRLDLEEPRTFGAALAGADALFLIARPGDPQPERTAKPLIDACREAGVQHVVNLSAMGVGGVNEIGLRAVELYLERSGVAFTHLRPNFFMQLFTSGALLASIRTRSELLVPAGDAKISFIDACDVAAAAVTALSSELHRNRAYTLTGPEALDHERVAAEVSAVAGRTIRYVAIDEDVARRVLAQAGFGPEWVDRLLGFYRLVRGGHAAPVDADLSELLGHSGTRFASFCREHAHVWTHAP